MTHIDYVVCIHEWETAAAMWISGNDSGWNADATAGEDRLGVVLSVWWVYVRYRQ